MDKSSLRETFLKYAKNPVSPSSCGILAIINGVFAPFLYVPISSFSGRLLTESIESISLFNRGSGIIIILLSLIGFVLLIKKKYLSSLIPIVLSAIIIIIEVYMVTVAGVSGRQYSSIHDPNIFLPSGPLVVYDLVVRGQLGIALGYLVGGHVSFLFAVVMGLKQTKRKIIVLHQKPKLRIFLGILLLLVVILALLYFFFIIRALPIAETRNPRFLN